MSWGYSRPGEHLFQSDIIIDCAYFNEYLYGIDRLKLIYSLELPPSRTKLESSVLMTHPYPAPSPSPSLPLTRGPLPRRSAPLSRPPPYLPPRRRAPRRLRRGA